MSAKIDWVNRESKLSSKSRDVAAGGLHRFKVTASSGEERTRVEKIEIQRR